MHPVALPLLAALSLLPPPDLVIEGVRSVAIESHLDASAFARTHCLAHVVGNAHGWQMDEATRSGWRDEVLRGTDGGSQAPSWLWSSVVELAGRHEVGYLQHCLRYATAEAA